MFRMFITSLLFTSSMTAYAGFETSSYKKDARLGDNYWSASAALDSNLETCWMVDPEQNNRGQWIQLDVPSATVDKLALVSGWDKSDNDFFDYARIKKAKVEVFDMGGNSPVLKSETMIDVADQRGWQIFDLTDAKVGGEILGGRVRVTVVEVYEGKDYPNLAVSEVLVHLKEFAAESLELSTPPSDVGSGSGAALTDGSTRSYWASTPGAEKPSFGVSAPGYGLSRIGLQGGPSSFARAKTIEVQANGSTLTYTMENNATMQWFLLPVMVGYTGSAWNEIQVTVVDVHEGGAGKGVAFSEVKINAATIEDF